MSQQRSPEEIRASIEANREGLTQAVVELSSGVELATDWRHQVRRNPQQVAGAVAALGFVLGGGVAALGGLFSR